MISLLLTESQQTLKLAGIKFTYILSVYLLKSSHVYISNWHMQLQMVRQDNESTHFSAQLTILWPPCHLSYQQHPRETFSVVFFSGIDCLALEDPNNLKWFPVHSFLNAFFHFAKTSKQLMLKPLVLLPIKVKITWQMLYMLINSNSGNAMQSVI